MKKLVLAGIVAASVMVGNVWAKSEVYNIDSCQFTIIDNPYIFKMTLLNDDVNRDKYLSMLCRYEPNQKSKIHATDSTFTTSYYKDIMVDAGHCTYHVYVDGDDIKTDYLQKCKENIKYKVLNHVDLGKSGSDLRIDQINIKCLNNGKNSYVNHAIKRDSDLYCSAKSGCSFETLDDAAQDSCK